MSFLICERHNKIEKVGAKVAPNGFICMNRYCPNSFKVFCGACKNEHRDHSIKVLSIEDIIFLTDRLVKTPFLQVGKYVGEAVDMLKKLKLIKQFRKKIDLLEKEIQKEALRLIDSTESLIHQYVICKGSVTDLADILAAVDQPKDYSEFVANSKELLSNLDYNFKKDKLEYCNAVIRQREDKRRKSIDNSKRKIEEVKDYSMKIIEVILHNNDSEDEEEDIAYTKKHYELLKQEVCAEKNELELDSEISELKNSKSTAANRTSRIRRTFETHESQTSSEMLSKEEANEELEQRLQEMRSFYLRIEDGLRLKISIIAKQKQNTNRELGKMKLKYEEKRKQILKLETHLRKNLQLRQEKQTERQQLFQHVVELTQWKGLTLQDRYE